MFCIMKGNEREFDPLVKSRVCKLGAVDQRGRRVRESRAEAWSPAGSRAKGSGG